MNAIDQVWLSELNVQRFDRHLKDTGDGPDRTLVTKLRQEEIAKLGGLKAARATATREGRDRDSEQNLTANPIPATERPVRCI